MSSSDAPEGIVVALRPGRATVRVVTRPGCPRCAAGRGCGAGIFTGRGGPRLVELSVPAGMSLRVGEPVRLALQPERLLYAAWLVYGIPLFALLAAALAADVLLPEEASDVAALAIVAAGLLCGGWWARRRLRQAGCAARFRPAAVPAGRHPAAAGDA